MCSQNRHWASKCTPVAAILARCPGAGQPRSVAGNSDLALNRLPPIPWTARAAPLPFSPRSGVLTAVNPAPDSRARPPRRHPHTLHAPRTTRRGCGSRPSIKAIACAALAAVHCQRHANRRRHVGLQPLRRFEDRLGTGSDGHGVHHRLRRIPLPPVDRARVSPRSVHDP